MNDDGGCGHQQTAGELSAQVCCLGRTVGGHLALFCINQMTAAVALA